MKHNKRNANTYRDIVAVITVMKYLWFLCTGQHCTIGLSHHHTADSKVNINVHNHIITDCKKNFMNYKKDLFHPHSISLHATCLRNIARISPPNP